jgi:hypothetical protein
VAADEAVLNIVSKTKDNPPNIGELESFEYFKGSDL